MLSRTVLAAGCATALLLAPVATSGIDLVPAGLSIQAHAKNGGNGGSNGSDRGNGGGRDHANSGRGHTAGGKGRSTVARADRRSGKGGQNSRGKPQNLGDFVGGILNTARSALGAEPRIAKRGQRLVQKPRGNRLAASAPALPQGPVPIPQPRPSVEQNFHAKLAGLNSLNRNYHAYLNSNDPKMAAIQDYVMASVGYETVAEDLAVLEAEYIAAQAEFDVLLSTIEPHDEFSYEGLSPAELEARLETLDTVDTTTLSDEEFVALEAERQALEDALASEEFATVAETGAAVAEQETELSELEAATTDETLEEALLAGANRNRIEQYGAENYVDQEMLDWAKGILGVGDAYGKIDEIRTELESAEAPADGELLASE